MVSASAWAQSADSPAPPARSARKAILFWASAVAADQITTYCFSSQYHDLLHERNVLVKGLDGHPVWLVGAGSAIDAASGWAAWKVLGDRHPRVARIAFYAAGAYRSYLAVHNLDMMRRAGAMRAQGTPPAR
jgi:hypothetical protein